MSLVSEGTAAIRATLGITVRRNMIFGEVADERRRQIAKWGADHQTHPHASRAHARNLEYWRYMMLLAKATCDRLSRDEIAWEDILFEEVTEAFAEEDWPTRRKELIQVMAVACAEVEDGDVKQEALTQVSGQNPAGGST